MKMEARSLSEDSHPDLSVIAYQTLKADNSIDARLRYISGVSRVRSTCLMLTGSLLGFLGFGFAAFLGINSQYNRERFNIDGEQYPSGQHYFPETVSEMVSHPDSPAGKAFFGFVITGATCILISWYPWYLRNVYVGDDIWSCQGFKGLFLNLRSLLPPVGMIIVACIRVVPKTQRTFADQVTANLHTVGAVSAIGGFCGLETITLIVYPTNVSLSPIEWQVRFVLCVCCIVAILCFQVGGFLANNSNFGHPDQWVPVTMANVNKALANDKPWTAQEDMFLYEAGFLGLYDTASGIDLMVKKLEFWGETLSGLLMIASHLAIWYFCPERLIDLDEQMPGV